MFSRLCARTNGRETHFVGLQQVQEEVQLLHHVILLLFALENTGQVGQHRPSTQLATRVPRPPDWQGTREKGGSSPGVWRGWLLNRSRLWSPCLARP